MNKKKSGLLALGAAALAAAFLLTPSLTASAAVSADRSTPPAGSNWEYGVPFNELPLCFNGGSAINEISPQPVGGWDSRSFISSGNWDGEDDDVVKARWLLSEPCNDEGYNPLSMQTMSQVIPVLGGFDSSRLYGGKLDGSSYRPDSLDGDFVGTVTCANSEWSRTSTQIVKPFNATFSSVANNTPARTHTAFSVVSGSCNYLVEIRIPFCTPQTGFHGSANILCSWATWSAERSYGQTSYPTGASDYELLICSVYFDTSPNCLYVPGLGSNQADGTDYQEVCSGAPDLEPDDAFDFFFKFAPWVGATIGHFTRCLFVPVNGWDSDGLVAETWENGFQKDVLAPITGAVDSFRIVGTCGVLINSDPQVFQGQFSVNTCSWTGWAAPMRVAIGIALLAASGFFGVRFVLATLSSFVSKKAPTPTGED